MDRRKGGAAGSSELGKRGVATMTIVRPFCSRGWPRRGEARSKRERGRRVARVPPPVGEGRAPTGVGSGAGVGVGVGERHRRYGERRYQCGSVAAASMGSTAGLKRGREKKEGQGLFFWAFSPFSHPKD